MAMGVVFSALLVLCLSFLLISKIGSAVARRNKRESHENATEVPGAAADSRVRLSGRGGAQPGDLARLPALCAGRDRSGAGDDGQPGLWRTEDDRCGG